MSSWSLRSPFRASPPLLEASRSGSALAERRCRTPKLVKAVRCRFCDRCSTGAAADPALAPSGAPHSRWRGTSQGAACGMTRACVCRPLQALLRQPRTAVKVVHKTVEMWKKERFANSGKLWLEGSCIPSRPALLSPLRRARDAGRTKQILRAVAGRRKSPGCVDESVIGSANDLAQRCLRVPRRQILFGPLCNGPAPHAQAG
jgi:hypothetical protein